MHTSLALLSNSAHPFPPAVASIQNRFGKRCLSETRGLTLSLQQIAKAVLDYLTEPAGVFVAKQLLSYTASGNPFIETEKIHSLMLREAFQHLEEQRQDSATKLLSAVEKNLAPKECATLLADLVRAKVFQLLQGEESNQSSLRRLITVFESGFSECEPAYVMACKRVRLYAFLLEQESHFSQAGASSAKRHHYLLRMAKSNTSLKKEEFYGLLPGEGMAMVLDDLDTYLARNPQSKMAQVAKSALLHSRALALEGFAADLLSRREHSPTYVQLYFDDVFEEVQSLSDDDRLLLFGGPFDHAMLHEWPQGVSHLKTFNSGQEVSQQHIPKNNERYQTHMVSQLSKAHITREAIANLLGAKWKAHNCKNEVEKQKLSLKQVNEIYKTLRKMAAITPARTICTDDPLYAHKKQTQETCMRSIYQHWLKELLATEYPAYKLAFSEKAQNEALDSRLHLIGQETLNRRKKKAAL